MPLAARLLLVALLGYLTVVALMWAFQTRLVFLRVRAPVPDPRAEGIPHGERISITTSDQVTLRGWYLPPDLPADPQNKAPALLWFYGNGESVGAIGSLAAGLRPHGYGLLLLDYRGYGENGGRSSEDGLYRDAEAGYDYLALRPEIDAGRIAVYGRSLGSVAALYLGTSRLVAAVVLDSPFTSARAMAQRHYPFLPRFLLRLSLDNLSRARRLHRPLLVFHGTADRIAPVEMGRALAEAGHGDLVLIKGAGHNDTYDLQRAAYRTAMQRFLDAAMAPLDKEPR